MPDMSHNWLKEDYIDFPSRGLNTALNGPVVTFEEYPRGTKFDNLESEILAVAGCLHTGLIETSKYIHID